MLCVFVCVNSLRGIKITDLKTEVKGRGESQSSALLPCTLLLREIVCSAGNNKLPLKS